MEHYSNSMSDMNKTAIILSIFLLLVTIQSTLFFFGTLGLVVFPWKGMNIIPQLAHIIMTLNVLWVVWDMLKKGDYKTASIGMLAGIIIWFL